MVLDYSKLIAQQLPASQILALMGYVTVRLSGHEIEVDFPARFLGERAYFIELAAGAF